MSALNPSSVATAVPELGGSCVSNRTARRTSGFLTPIGLLFLALLPACDFNVVNPGPVQDSFLDDPGAHEAAVAGASFALSLAVGPLAHVGAEVAGEVSRSGANWAQPRLPRDFGQLTLIDTSNEFWDRTHRARWVAEDASRRLEEVLGPAASSSRLNALAKLYAGFANRVLGENMCEAVIDGGPAQPGLVYFQRAEKAFSDAMDIAGRAGAEDILLAARAGRAGVRGPGLDNWAGAVSDASAVPLGFRFAATFSAAEADQYNLLHWVTAANPFREFSAVNTYYDSYYTTTGDPRVRWTSAGFGLAAYVNVPFYRQQKFPDRGNPINLTSGREMILLRAEAQLRGGNWQSALALLNSLRDGMVSVHDGSALPVWDASNAEAVWTALKRERGIELWLEGRRMFDLRRWIADSSPGAMEDTSRRIRLCIPIVNSERETNPNVPLDHQDPVNPLFSG